MKKKLIIILVLLLSCLIVVSCDKESNNKEEKNIVEEKLSKMTLDEKIGQMMIIYYLKGEVDDTLRNSLNKVKPGGFILFKENITTYDDTLKFIKEIKASSDIPMFMSIDQEGGNVQRLRALTDKPVSNIPYMADVGLVDDLTYTEEVGNVIGEELRVFGVNMDFAPDIDVLEVDSNVIGKRSFGSDASKVGLQGLALAKGLEKNNIIPVYKHFPGHGCTSTDSHYDLPVINKTKEELLISDLIPFKSAIDNNAEVIMIGHLAIPNITGDNTPASLSKELINDLLIKELGYKGLVVTDALNMGALTNNYTKDEIYVKAINAGVNLLLMPSGSVDALKSIKKSVQNGLISEELIDNSVRKILELKYSKIVDTYDEYLDSSYLGNDHHQEVLARVK